MLLWAYPDTKAAPLKIATDHLANIFGVRILPCTGNRRLVTGAMDCCVQLHTLDAAPAAHRRARERPRSTVRWHPDEANEAVAAHTTKFLCHSKRVKVAHHSAYFGHSDCAHNNCRAALETYSTKEGIHRLLVCICYALYVSHDHVVLHAITSQVGGSIAVAR